MSDTAMSINAAATPFPEFNDLLVELTSRAATILGTNFVGAYLQGSFAEYAKAIAAP